MVTGVERITGLEAAGGIERQKRFFIERVLAKSYTVSICPK